MEIVSEVRIPSDTVALPLVAAPLGAETKRPAAVVVAQGGGGVAPLTVAVHPAGRAGATTPSKCSLKPGTKFPSPRVNVTLPRSVGPSWRWSVAVIEPPQLPCAVKVKGRETGGPIGSSVPQGWPGPGS